MAHPVGSLLFFSLFSHRLSLCLFLSDFGEIGGAESRIYSYYPHLMRIMPQTVSVRVIQATW